MTDYLVFHLYGPMAAWGDIAVGEVRPSHTHPSKSAILGLLAAALGINRDEETKHRQLAEGYGFAVRVDYPGIPLSDYHTVQVPSSGTGRNRRRFATRRDEIMAQPKHDLNTILSTREYRMDASYVVALWPNANPPFDLRFLAEKLLEPVYVLYLGRKSCPLALPLQSQVIEAESIQQAFSRAVFSNFEELRNLSKRPSPAFYWEEGGNAGMDSQHVFERRDTPLSRKRWQFMVRREHHAGTDRRE